MNTPFELEQIVEVIEKARGQKLKVGDRFPVKAIKITPIGIYLFGPNQECVPEKYLRIVEQPEKNLPAGHLARPLYKEGDLVEVIEEPGTQTQYEDDEFNIGDKFRVSRVEPVLSGAVYLYNDSGFSIWEKYVKHIPEPHSEMPYKPKPIPDIGDWVEVLKIDDQLIDTEFGSGDQFKVAKKMYSEDSTTLFLYDEDGWSINWDYCKAIEKHRNNTVKKETLTKSFSKTWVGSMEKEGKEFSARLDVTIHGVKNYPHLSKCLIVGTLEGEVVIHKTIVDRLDEEIMVEVQQELNIIGNMLSKAVAKYVKPTLKSKITELMENFKVE